MVWLCNSFMVSILLMLERTVRREDSVPEWKSHCGMLQYQLHQMAEQ